MKKIRIVLVLLVGLWSLTLGWGMAQALDKPAQFERLKSVDSVPSRYQNGYELYLETCSGCHIPIPPEVLPTESWKQILEKPDKHYGTQLKEMIRLTQLLIWDYVSTFSRPLLPDEPIPLYVEQSRYFKALHPRVELPKPTTTKTCLICHPNAANFDYRALSPEWQEAP